MECCGPGYASPAEAMQAPREKLLYTIAIYTGTGIQKPDYLATIDNDPDSPTYSQVISRCEVPGIGDELHHMGWNACSSCFDDASMARKYLLVPGVRSSNIHIIDCATDPRNPTLFKVIDGADIKAKPISAHRIQSIAWVRKLSFQCWAMRKATHQGAIYTSIKT